MCIVCMGVETSLIHVTTPCFPAIVALLHWIIIVVVTTSPLVAIL